MSAKRQKNQLVLAFTEGGRSEAPKASREGTESLTAKCDTERPARHGQLMEEVCERENCWQAYKRVKANKGSPGIDGMSIGDLSGLLKQHWPTIRKQLLCGTYQPQPVRRVEIPKADGGVRKLGIPTLLDRFILQAVMQVLQRSWDPTFSEHSHGFRPKRSAHQAVAKAQQYISAGNRWVVSNGTSGPAVSWRSARKSSARAAGIPREKRRWPRCGTHREPPTTIWDRWPRRRCAWHGGREAWCPRYRR